MTVSERLHMPSLDGAAEWLNSEPLSPAELRGQRRPGELLDADVHQLAAHGAVRSCLVAGLPRRRAGRHRSPHAGVLLRARDRPGAAGDQGSGDRLPGRGRQRLRDLERLRQPLLAGAVLHRPRRHHPRLPLRRRTLRAIRAQSSSGCSASSANSSPSKGVGVEAEADWDHLRTPETYLGYGRSEHFASPDGAAFDERRAYELPDAAALQPLGARRRVDDRARRRSCSTRPAGASPSGSTRATRISCCLRSARADPVPRAPRRRGSRPVTRRRRRRGRQRRAPRRPHVPARARSTTAVRERTLEITFLEPGAEAYVFTFG